MEVGRLYKVAPPELKISPIMYFVIQNTVSGVIQNIENRCTIFFISSQFLAILDDFQSGRQHAIQPISGFSPPTPLVLSASKYYVMYLTK